MDEANTTEVELADCVAVDLRRETAEQVMAVLRTLGDAAVIEQFEEALQRMHADNCYTGYCDRCGHDMSDGSGTAGECNGGAGQW